MLPTEEEILIRDMARQFAQERLKPFAADWDREHRFPAEAIAEDIAYLSRVWNVVERRGREAASCSNIYEDLSLPLRAAADLLGEVIATRITAATSAISSDVESTANRMDSAVRNALEQIQVTSRHVDELISVKAVAFEALSDRVFDMPEIAYTEYRSVAEHKAELERQGFRITENLAGIPTAIMGEAGEDGLVGLAPSWRSASREGR